MEKTIVLQTRLLKRSIMAFHCAELQVQDSWVENATGVIDMPDCTAAEPLHPASDRTASLQQHSGPKLLQS
jgi:hypothetical protein